jgi:hypothetical protein
MVPKFNKRFICIVGRKTPTLAAIILSYINNEGSYTPIFEFPETKEKNYDVSESDINYAHVTRAYETSVRIRNAISAMQGCDYVILAGLNENQKTYLSFDSGTKIIDIQDVCDVDILLREISSKKEYLACKAEDVYNGLYIARDKMLQLDETADKLEEGAQNREGLVVIEDNGSSSMIIGIGYALSIGLDVAIVTPPNISKKEIVDLLENWKSTGDVRYFNDLSAKIYPSIEQIDFSKYKFATFFTYGAPYSLVLKNVIPITHVNIDLHPDFFIFNNILFELSNSLYSSIVFSPLEFGTDEETNFVIERLKEKGYYVKELIGKEATSFNIDRHVSEFPYNILHICSHGGTVDGYPVSLEFKDREGTTHIVEFDEIVSFAPEPGNPMVQVTSKWIFRKFDGFYWLSKELKSQNYSHDVYNDMYNAIRSDKKKRTEIKSSIPDSCAIKCYDFNYQAMFNSIAGVHSTPFIFNNTCWSSSEISNSFLAVGGRGYIGTLWKVGNEVAKQVAESFYRDVFDTTILNALQNALPKSNGTPSENIYVFWGLHFATIKSGINQEVSRMNVASKLLSSVYRWREHLTGVKNDKTKERINKLIDWNCNLLKKEFRNEAIQLILQRKK